MVEHNYSATPLWKKLGLREESRVRFVDAPRGFAALLDVPWRLRQTKTDEYDVVVLFTADGAELDASVAALERDLATARRAADLLSWTVRFVDPNGDRVHAAAYPSDCELDG